MRGSLNLCLLGAATSLVLSPRRLVPAMPKRGTDAERVAALLARGNDSGYTLSGEDTPLTPERFAAEILNLPGCRAWAYLSRPNDLRAASVLVPGNEKKPYTVEKAKGALRARAPRDDVLAGSSRTGNSSADRRAASTWEPNANASAGQRKRHRKQREIEAEEKKWSGTAQERLNTATFGSALVPHRSASVADWQHWNGVYPTTPGTPGFEPSFFYARKHKAMFQVLERETDAGMTCDDWLLDLYQGADLEATINRGETAQACQCLATAGVITNDEIGQLVIEHAFGWSLFRNKEVVIIDGAAAHAQANAWFNFCEDNQLGLWAKNITRRDDEYVVNPSDKGDAKYAQERCGRPDRWDKTFFADLIVKNSWAGRPDDLPRLDTRPLDENNFQLAKIQKGASDEAGRFTITTVCYIDRIGRNAVVHLPATRWGLLPLKRLTEEKCLEIVGRFREFAEARNDDAKLKKLARGVMVHPKSRAKRGRNKGENYGIIVTRDSPENVAHTLWQNMFKPEARATKVIQDFLDDIYALMAEFFPEANHAALRRDPKFVELALRGVIDDESEYEPNYDELPTIHKSLYFDDKVAKSFTAFGKVLRARCITLREEHPGCITWPGPTPGPGPAPGGGVGDILDGLDMGTIHPGHDMSPDEVWNFL